MKVIYSWRLRKEKRPKPDTKKLKSLIREIAKLANIGLMSDQILSVNFIGPVVMRRINREFLNHDYLTDVICFNYAGDPDFSDGDVAVEIFISPDIAAERAAEERNLDYRSELLLYLVHAILHASGLEDKTPGEKAEMREMEFKVLNKLKQKSLSFPFRTK